MRISLRAIPLLSVLALAACTPAKEPQADGRLTVAASFYPLAFIAEQVGGENASIKQITPQGVDPHEYEPTPQDVLSAERSRIVLLNGAGQDVWGEDLRPALERAGVTVLMMTDVLTTLAVQGESEEDHEEEEEHEEGDEHGEEEHHDHGGIDPHVWLDPVNALRMTEVIRDAFVAADPAHGASYNANADVFMRRLRTLDEQFRAGLAQCALSEIIVSHDAFSYMAERYGFDTLAIAGLSPEEEPSPRRLTELVEIAEEHGIEHVFFETLVSPALAETLARELGATTLVLHPLEGLTREEQERGETYISLMEANLHNVRIGLKCP